MAKNGGLALDLVKGSLAGALATWTMGRVTTALYEHEDPSARKAEEEARGGLTSYARGADKAAEVVGVVVTPEQRQSLGMALHWGLGIGAGVAYAVLRRELKGSDWGQGAGFGTGFWLLVDEGLVPALGLTPGPGAFPWQAHARGWAGHLAFGLVADTALDLMDRVM